MRVFLTGATGYIGSAVAEALKTSGHVVRGLARSEDAANKLEAAGVGVVRGNLRDAASLASGAREADGVIHAGVEWGPRFGEVDRAAVEAILSGLEASGKPFVYTSGTWPMGNTGEEVVGDDAPLAPPPVVEWRLGVERLVREASGRKVRGVVIRPGMVYGRGGGELAGFVRQARESGGVKYVGTGENHWSFVHVDALAKLYVMALEKAGAGVMLVATNGPPLRVREVAEAAARLGGTAARAEPWPLEEARKQIGQMADGMVLDQRIAGTRARQLLGWNPEAPSVLVELSRGSYT